LLSLLNVEDLQRISYEQRRLIFDSCFRSNHTNMIAPFPAYKRMHQMYSTLGEMGELQLEYLAPQYLADLLVWYHLAWMGESVRRNNELVSGLMAKECLFTHGERQQLFELIGQLMRDIIPRYRKLQESGQIEISTTAHYHPILPLLIDFNSALEAMPGANLPRTPRYPGGLERSAAHITSAKENYRQHFGKEAGGMWPSEGSISFASVAMLAEHGCKWTASGEAVLFNSLRRIYGEHVPERTKYLYRPYRCPTNKGDIFCFFRDDQLSDKIGFEYTKWHGRDAVSDFIRALEDIRERCEPDQEPMVSVILDGENAWEYYPYNGYYFLAELYEALEHHPFIRARTFAECAELLGSAAAADHPSEERIKVEVGNLPTIAAGSWVYGTFSTWIGSPEKNHAWDLLCEAKKSYDRVIQSDRLAEDERRLAEQQLGICEGSDWFWWFGDYNPSLSVQAFDRLFRLNLSNLYRLLKLPAPVELQHTISVGKGAPAMGGTMRRSTQ
jgi:alpha-amylase/alpha-mannosidase (GH57 family)